MSAVCHYKSNLRDIFFNLFEVFELPKNTFGVGPFANWDESTAKEALEAFEKLCVDKLASSFAISDHEPLRMDEKGNVFLPKAVRESLDAFYAGDWHLFEMPEHLGGMSAPKSLYWATFEMMVGANPPIALYTFGSFSALLVELVGTPEQKKRLTQASLDGHWGGTMVLTEPDAGSDVGAGRTKARHLEGEIWEIEGVKRFITNGDFDGVENILHMVLARPEGADVGTKGLSMFIVPKYWVDENGKTTHRNGVYCTNLEKKMGIKGSATCEMTFGEKEPARGFLLGNVHEGIRQMFKVIEQARMAVGIKSMSTLSTAYLNALDFAKERVQGPDLLKALDKHSPRVRIIEHPDVRRMLMTQKAHVEGMRALCMYASWAQDQVHLNHDNPSKAKEFEMLNDFLLPLIKGYLSEKVYELLAVSLQVYGGSGYLTDYPIEQYIRDQKIDSLYEGTTHIQALDLIFRKIAKNGGATLQGIMAQIQETLTNRKVGDALTEDYAALSMALEDAQSIFMIMMEKLGESFYHAGIVGNRVLACIAELVIGWLLVRQAEIAVEKLPTASDQDKAFYEGKLAATRFFCSQALPNLRFNRDLIAKSTLDLVNIGENVF